MRNWNKFKLVGDGDFLRKYAREHGLFIYPYDLLTGADIALFEDFETKKNDEHFLVCTMNDVKVRPDKLEKIYRLSAHNRGRDVFACRGATYEAALAGWNKEMQKLAKTLLKPLPQRFLSIESNGLFLNVLGWGIFVYILGAIPFVHEFLRENVLAIIFILLCCNLEHLFIYSYGEEIPRSTLELWAAPIRGRFSEGIYGQMMGEWEERKERHENALPWYLLWKRGKLRPGAETEEVAVEAAPAVEEEPEHLRYCREIRQKLTEQITTIEDQRTKIADRAIRRYADEVLKILGEIKQAVSPGTLETQVIEARKVVSYWNEETISLLENYLLLARNSSREAQDTQSSIAALLHDMAAVYRKELGRITANHTLEMKASMNVLQKEIEETLGRERN